MTEKYNECRFCGNFEPLPNSHKQCTNYKPKLPKVTKKEVGLKFWEFADTSGLGGCEATKEYFGICGIPVECSHTDCGDCISKFTGAINKERGY